MPIMQNSSYILMIIFLWYIIARGMNHIITFVIENNKKAG